MIIAILQAPKEQEQLRVSIIKVFPLRNLKVKKLKERNR